MASDEVFCNVNGKTRGKLHSPFCTDLASCWDRVRMKKFRPNNAHNYRKSNAGTQVRTRKREVKTMKKDTNNKTHLSSVQSSSQPQQSIFFLRVRSKPLTRLRPLSPERTAGNFSRTFDQTDVRYSLCSRNIRAGNRSLALGTAMETSPGRRKCVNLKKNTPARVAVKAINPRFFALSPGLTTGAKIALFMARRFV